MNRIVKICFLFICLLNTTKLTANEDFLIDKNGDFTLSEKAVKHRPFLIFSPPKCGTHLIAKVIGLITKKSAQYNLGDISSNEAGVKWVKDCYASKQFAVAHNFNEEMLNKLTKDDYRVIFTLRDPRDQLVSVMNWLKEGQWPHLLAAKIADHDQQLSELITGANYGWRCVNSYFLKYEKALKNISSKKVFYVRFENLVGPLGGGTSDTQLNEIKSLANFLKITLSDTEVVSIANQIFGNSPTFRQGQIGSWKIHFTNTHKSLFKQRYNKHLIRLGYEKNSKW